LKLRHAVALRRKYDMASFAQPELPWHPNAAEYSPSLNHALPFWVLVINIQGTNLVLAEQASL
jgi:hypothetical protein